MNLNEIEQLRQAGKTEEAYTECKSLLSQSSDDRFVRISMAQCLKSLAERLVAEKNTDRFLDLLQELADLRLADIGERKKTNLFSWEIKNLLESLKNEPDHQLATADRILAVLPKLSFAKPDKYYSILADQFLKIRNRQNYWPGFIDFMDWFGFDNLLPKDYNRINLKEPGKSIPSIAERVHSAYYRALMGQIQSGGIDEHRIEDFIERLTKLASQHPEFQNTLYYKAKLLLVLNRKEDALDAVRPFVKRKQNEFWVWNILSETVDNVDIKLSCCCRALLCHAEAEYLGKVHLQAAKLMHTLGYDGNARREIREMDRIYQKNSWKMPQEAIDLARQAWYQAATAPESNVAFYREHLSESEEFLFIDTPEIPILITHYNNEKRICSFVTTDKKRGFFSTKKLKGKFIANHIYIARVDGDIEDDKITTLLTCKQIEDARPYVGVFFKKIEGSLRYREGNSYAFVDDVFVDKKYLPEPPANGLRVVGTAIISYNLHKETWGWKAISLRLQENRDAN